MTLYDKACPFCGDSGPKSIETDWTDSHWSQARITCENCTLEVSPASCESTEEEAIVALILLYDPKGEGRRA